MAWFTALMGLANLSCTIDTVPDSFIGIRCGTRFACPEGLVCAADRRCRMATVTAYNDAYVVSRGGTLTVPAAAGVLENDVSNYEGPLRASLVTPPAQGTLELATDGAFELRLPPDFAGRLSFVYRAEGEGVVSAAARVMITVSTPPTGEPDVYLAPTSRPLLVPIHQGVLANDTAPEGAPLTAEVIQQPRSGSLTLEPGGAFSFAAASDFRGIDFFSYRASDGVHQTPEITVTLVAIRLPAGLPLERVSTAMGNSEGDGFSDRAHLSADGSVVVFRSSAKNLLPGLSGSFAEIFRHDRLTAETQLISRSFTGGAANNDSNRPQISADGRTVVFSSEAANLVSRDSSATEDVFAYDSLAGLMRRASVSDEFAEGDGPSVAAGVSADGRFVVFSSTATNLVTGDTNAAADVFINDRDLETFRTLRVSVAPDQSEPNSASSVPAISANGRYVAFSSTASNLVEDDTNGARDIFVHDLATRATTRVSVGVGGEQADWFSEGPHLSADGRYVAFWSRAANLVPGDLNELDDVFVQDRFFGTTTRVSVSSAGEEISGVPLKLVTDSPTVSADGRFVAFASYGPNLVPGDTNEVADIFVRDLDSGQTMRLSVAADGSQANADCVEPYISADGRYVVFSSRASNLVAGDGSIEDVFVAPVPRVLRQIRRASVEPEGSTAGPLDGRTALSAKGRWAAFVSRSAALVPNDSNGAADVFVRDLKTGAIERISVGTAATQASGESGQPSISGSGRYVAFASAAPNLVPGDTNGSSDIFVRDRFSGTTSRVSVSSGGGEANGPSSDPAISADGRFIAFSSSATNLVSLDGNDVADVFVHDSHTGETLLVSRGHNGAESDGPSGHPSLSESGRFVVFESSGANLVAGDSNGASDVFRYDLATATLVRVSVSAGGGEPDGPSDSPHLSASGRLVTFRSDATNLVAGDTNGVSDIFVRDLGSSVNQRISVSTGGEQAQLGSSSPRLSGDGTFVVFTSMAANLVPGDPNEAPDVFVHDLVAHETRLLSVSTEGLGANGESRSPGISLDGRYVSFSSVASNLVSGDTNGAADVYVAPNLERVQSP